MESAVKQIYILFFTIFTFCLTGCFQQNDYYQGYLEGDYVNLSSDFSGILKKLLVDRGDQVIEGQLVYVLDDEPEASALSEAEEKLSQAEKTLSDLEEGERDTVLESIKAQKYQADAELALAESNLERFSKLYKQGYVEKALLDEAQSEYDKSFNHVAEFIANLAEARRGARNNQIKAQFAQVQAAKAEVKQAKWSLAQKMMYAPKAALVFDTFFEEGEFVNSQQPVASLLAPEDIKLIFFVPEFDRSKLSVGQIVNFGCDGCEKRTKATIEFISPEAEYTPPVIFSRESREKLVYRIEAHLSLEDAKRFYPGQPVDVYLK